MYSIWSVAQLRAELRKRDASTTGKKAALVERLEAYDRNNVILAEDELEDDHPNIPALEKFKDVNSSTALPALSKTHIQEFAERFQIPPQGKMLYESRSLVTLRVAYDCNHAYFHAQCKAKMKEKNCILLYSRWIKLVVYVKVIVNVQLEVAWKHTVNIFSQSSMA